MTTFIFDLDGVLVDTAKYHYLAWKEIADINHFKFDESINEKLKGVSRTACLEIILKESKIEISIEEKNALLKRKNEIYLSFIESLKPNEVLPGVIDTLDFAKKNNIYICLGSASKNARPILDKTGLTEYFDCIIDGTSVTRAKPDPEVFIKGAKQLGVQPSECIVFEDSEAGIQAAINAGMKAIGIGKKELLMQASIVLNNLEEINPQQLIKL